MVVFGKIRNFGDCSSAYYYDSSDTCRTVIGSKQGSTLYRLPGAVTSSMESLITATGTGGAGPMTATPGAGWNATATNAVPTGWFAGSGAQLGERCMQRTALIDNGTTLSVWPPMTSASPMAIGM